MSRSAVWSSSPLFYMPTCLFDLHFMLSFPHIYLCSTCFFNSLPHFSHILSFFWSLFWWRSELAAACYWMLFWLRCLLCQHFFSSPSRHLLSSLLFHFSSLLFSSLLYLLRLLFCFTSLAFPSQTLCHKYQNSFIYRCSLMTWIFLDSYFLCPFPISEIETWWSLHVQRSLHFKGLPPRISD